MSKAICQTNKDIPQDMTLGNLLYYSLSEMKIAETDLLDIFTNNNIPERYVRKISKADAFRRATSSIKGSALVPDPNNRKIWTKAKIEIDEVKSDSNGILRIMGRKLINDAAEEVDYEQVAELTFDRSTEMMSYNILTSDLNEFGVYERFCMDIIQTYHSWSVYHTKDTIKNTINRIIGDTHPVNLMPTGLCKFVPKVHTDLLYSLKESLSEMEQFALQKGVAKNFMEVIPIIDTKEQRSLIEKASEREIKYELFEFTQELKEVLQNKTTLSSRTANSYLMKFKALREKVKDYESLLGNYLGFLTSQITESIQLVNDNLEDSEYDDSNV